MKEFLYKIKVVRNLKKLKKIFFIILIINANIIFTLIFNDDSIASVSFNVPINLYFLLRLIIFYLFPRLILIVLLILIKD